MTNIYSIDKIFECKCTLCKKQGREADDEPHIAGMFSPNGGGGGGSDEKKRRAQPYSYFLQ